jgi:hypothetical protein
MWATSEFQPERYGIVSSDYFAALGVAQNARHCEVPRVSLLSHIGQLDSSQIHLPEDRIRG